MLSNRDKYLKYLKITFFALNMVFFTSCTTMTGRYEQFFSYIGDDSLLFDQKLSHEYKLPYPKDAFERALAFFQGNFSKRHLAVDGQYSISLFNDSVWRVECPVRYRLNPQELSISGFGKSSTLLISRKDGDVLYFTIGKKETPRTNINVFLKWTPWPIKDHLGNESGQ